MGGCVSVSLPCDQVVNRFSDTLSVKWSYIHNLAENLESLKKDMEALKAKRNDVKRKVDREEFTGERQRLDQIQVWFKNILTIEDRCNDLLSTSELEFQRLCLCGFCSKNWKLSYGFGKRVVMMLKEVESLSGRGEFEVVTEAAPIATFEELPIQPTIVGQETMLDTLWKRLMDNEVKIVGLYGMGGVGKTTLLTQINNKFLEIRGEFDTVIWVVVSQNASVHRIQGDLGEKLGLSGKEWDEKNENQRAIGIHNILKRKKFVLLLDDIWKNWDLIKIGVPSTVSGSKVAFTTRSRDVCAGMGDHEPIKVSCLDTEKAWDLFKHNVGEHTLRSHLDIPGLAREVAKECRGLPLALTVIGKAMASKTTVQEWHHALEVLTSYAAKFAGMVEGILPILKYSYDDLKDKHVQSCFLYCSLFPEDSLMEKEELIGYWISEGFIDEKEGREKAYNQGYWIIGTLVRACLLLEEIEYSQTKVKMHDVVRDMALWIASDPGDDKERYVVKAGVGLREVPKVKDWRSVQRLSLMKNDIEKISQSVDCPELTTLLLQENRSLATISGKFFRSMPRLLVLDLSKANRLEELPEEISKLVSLRYLDLSATPISRLCLEKLKTLIYLDLESTWELENLEGISNLVSLSTLKLRSSKVLVDKSLMKELQVLQHLEYVTIDISSSLVVGGEQSSYESRIWSCIKELCIRERPKESARVKNLLAMENLSALWIEDCNKLGEIKIERRAWKNSSCLFSNLYHVVIKGCHGLKDLTWLLLVPKLSYLRVEKSKKIEEIISEEKAASLLEKETETDIRPPFQKLRSFYLEDLPELKRIYWNALPFQHLNTFRIKRCPKLTKLPLDSKTVSSVGIEYDDEEWKERIEWEDEATRQRFLPLFTKSLY